MNFNMQPSEGYKGFEIRRLGTKFDWLVGVSSFFIQLLQLFIFLPNWKKYFSYSY